MDKKIADYINKQKSPQREICLALRKILLKALPKAKEEMKWGVLGYDNGKYYIGVVRHGVNFGFAINGLTKEEISQFEGTGKTMRSIKIETIKDIDEKKLTQLIKLVHNKAICTPCNTN